MLGTCFVKIKNLNKAHAYVQGSWIHFSSYLSDMLSQNKMNLEKPQEPQWFWALECVPYGCRLKQPNSCLIFNSCRLSVTVGFHNDAYKILIRDLRTSWSMDRSVHICPGCWFFGPGLVLDQSQSVSVRKSLSLIVWKRTVYIFVYKCVYFCIHFYNWFSNERQSSVYIYKIGSLAISRFHSPKIFSFRDSSSQYKILSNLSFTHSA